MCCLLQPESCILTKVDALSIVIATANPVYTTKVVCFIEQLLKQFETGVHDYIVERQAVLRDTLFQADGKTLVWNSALVDNARQIN